MMPGITDPTEAFFKDGLWGWDGSQWRRAAMLFGYTDQVLSKAVITGAGAGSHTIDGAAVASGEIWIITAMEAHDAVSAVPSIFLGANAGGVSYWIAAAGATGAGIGFSWSGTMVLEAGQKPRCVITGVTAGDSLEFNYSGYKMSISS